MDGLVNGMERAGALYDEEEYFILISTLPINECQGEF
jgi:hypothetical protein